ncbi:MAG: DUF1559 domain-containing protein [Planctomycetaceae bacterium]
MNAVEHKRMIQPEHCQRLPEFRESELSRPVRRRPGFTLIELLVVISVIGVLVSLLLPAVQSVRESARRTQCQDHLHNLAVGLINYESTHKTLPPGSMQQGAIYPQRSGWGWGAMTLPFLEQKPLYDLIIFEQENTVGTNLGLLSTPLAIWRCPSSPSPEQILAQTPGQVNVLLATGNYPGNGAVLSAVSSTRWGDITDGASNTILVGENQFQEGVFGLESYTSSWIGIISFPDEYGPNSIPHLGISELTRINKGSGFAGAFGSQHPGGAQFAFGDGSVTFLSENMSMETYIAMGTHNGGETFSR